MSACWVRQVALEHSVGPSDGSCEMEVYGWNFARGFNPRLSFGGMEARPTYTSAETLTVRALKGGRVNVCASIV